uniref:Uncharacterized protein n=1 Tax=Octopus bimaculoides TaxID=37653 RepID=A0A0L8FK64_OCTBM
MKNPIFPLKSLDGTPVMVGSKNGFISKLKAEISMYKEPGSINTFYCRIHQQNLYAKSMKFSNVMCIVVPCVNIIKSRALNLLVHVVPRKEIFAFMDMKRKFASELQNEDWGRGHLVHDMYKHVKVFQTKLQLWERQLRNGNVFHFPTLAQHGQADSSTFAYEFDSFKKEFSGRF